MQKRKRRARKQSLQADSESMSNNSEILNSNPEMSNSEMMNNTESVSVLNDTEEPLAQGTSEEDLFDILDRLAEKRKRLWTDIQPEVGKLHESEDSHPSLVIDEDRHIEVFVGGENKDFRSFVHVSAGVFFKTSTLTLCKALRNKVESLQKEMDKNREKIIRVHKEKNREIGSVRNFWRNKILEQQSYGEKVLLSAIRRGSL